MKDGTTKTTLSATLLADLRRAKRAATWCRRVRCFGCGSMRSNTAAAVLAASMKAAER